MIKTVEIGSRKAKGAYKHLSIIKRMQIGKCC